jgi:hypothetical protein
MSTSTYRPTVMIPPVPGDPPPPPPSDRERQLEQHLVDIAARLQAQDAPDVEGQVRGIHTRIQEMEAAITILRMPRLPPARPSDLAAAYEALGAPLTVEYDRGHHGRADGSGSAAIRARVMDVNGFCLATLHEMDVAGTDVTTDPQAEALVAIVNAVPGLVAPVGADIPEGVTLVADWSLQRHNGTNAIAYSRDSTVSARVDGDDLVVEGPLDPERVPLAVVRRLLAAAKGG